MLSNFNVCVKWDFEFLWEEISSLFSPLVYSKGWLWTSGTPLKRSYSLTALWPYRVSLTAVSGVAHPQDRQLAAVFYSLGHPKTYTYDFRGGSQLGQGLGFICLNCHWRDDQRKKWDDCYSCDESRICNKVGFTTMLTITTKPYLTNELKAWDGFLLSLW
jgi:hypothetical protein